MMRYDSYERVIQFGGKPTSAIRILVVINAAIFIFEYLLNIQPVFNQFLGLVPQYTWSKLYLWQPFTYMFLHGGFWHIAINMFILWMFGSEIERIWGRKEFLSYYFLTGVGSGVLTALFSLDSTIPVVGASGAIYGILLAYGMMFPNRTIYLYFLIPVRVKYFVLFIGLVAFLSSLSDTGSTISHLTHLSGMVIGFVYLKSDWRLSGLRKSVTGAKIRRDIRKAEKVKKNLENMRLEVDRILDKINEVGYDNLSDEEKQTLEEASKAISKDRGKMN